MRIVTLHHMGFAPILRKLGHDVLTVSGMASADVRLAEPMTAAKFLEVLGARGFRPDLVLWYDACQPPWVFGFERLPSVVIGYSVDQYMHPWHVPYSAAFDAVLVAQKDYLPLFADSPTGRPAQWLPLFCDPARDLDPGRERDIPVSFVGTLDGAANPGRKPFLDAFKTVAPLFCKQGAYAPIFGRSRIVLNQSAAGELNFRLFEAMACGAAVLTEATGNGLTELFTPGTDILTYARGDAKTAAATAQAALADPAALAALAAAGKRQVLANHTLVQRARRIIALAEELAAAGAPARRLAGINAVDAELRKAYAMLATDGQLPLPLEVREMFLRMAGSMP
jgi:hypothetical protein